MKVDLTPEEFLSIAGLYLADFPPGLYHRRDDDPSVLYRDGSAIFSVAPLGRHFTGSLVAVLVLMLNARKAA